MKVSVNCQLNNMYNRLEDRRVGVPVGNYVYNILVGYGITVGYTILRLGS